MFGFHFRKGTSVVGRETSMADDLEDALTRAVDRGRALGADNILVCDASDVEIRVVPIGGHDTA